MASPDRLTGTVKWYDSSRGFSFITPEDGVEDVLFRQSSIEAVGVRALGPGEGLEFVASLGHDIGSGTVNVTNPSKPAKMDLASSLDFMANVVLSKTCSMLSVGVESEIKKPDQEPQRGVEARDWAELPSDILMVIFKKIAMSDILRSAQFVCKPWRRLSFVPALWKCINMKMCEDLHKMNSMAMVAVDRSAGCLEELYVESFPKEDFMHYVAQRAPSLRRLHLISVCLNKDTLIKTVLNFPLLEDLLIMFYSLTEEEIKQVSEACLHLTSFALNKLSCQLAYGDTEALAIAKHMKQLSRLHLFGNDLTSVGLSAILDSCPQLEHLDIRQCLNLDLNENLMNKCVGIKVLRLPYDSIADCEFMVDRDIVSEDAIYYCGSYCDFDADINLESGYYHGSYCDFDADINLESGCYDQEDECFLDFYGLR